MKNLILDILSRFNVHLTKVTSKDELQSLLSRLRPVSCEKPLVRLGPDGDGGYLVPDDFAGIKACFSPGVDCVSGFESDCANMGMSVFLADKSVENPAESHELFQFTKKYLGVTTNDDFMTLDDWVTSSWPASEDELLLQIDIEGAEYEVFLNVSDQLMKRFRIIVVEFHHVNQLWNKPFFDVVSRAFDKLLQTHSCVHNHPNNYLGSLKTQNMEMPRLTEMTFYRNDCIKNPSFVKTFPHPLDYDCSDNPSLDLPKCWYAT